MIDLPPAGYAVPEASAWAVLTNSDALRAEGAGVLDRFVARYFSNVGVVRKLEYGDPAREIVAAAEQEHSGLIMMPTGGYGRFRALLLGSVTAKVLHDAHCPVWTGVHADELAAHPADRWRRVLCALDSNPQDLDVLRWAACFASEQALELRLVHAVEGAGRALTQESDPGMYDFLFDIARERIAEMQSQAGTNLEVCLGAGSPGRVVREAALGRRSDLIIIGRGVLQKRRSAGCAATPTQSFGKRPAR